MIEKISILYELYVKKCRQFCYDWLYGWGYCINLQGGILLCSCVNVLRF